MANRVRYSEQTIHAHVRLIMIGYNVKPTQIRKSKNNVEARSQVGWLQIDISSQVLSTVGSGVVNKIQILIHHKEIS